MSASRVRQTLPPARRGLPAPSIWRLATLTLAGALACTTVVSAADAQTAAPSVCASLQAAVSAGNLALARSLVKDARALAPQGRCSYDLVAIERLLDRLPADAASPVGAGVGAGIGTGAGAAPRKRAEGVGEFVFWTTSYGLTSGLLLNTALDVQSTRASIAVPMVTTLAGLAGGWGLSRAWPFTEGMAGAVTAGAWWGMADAFMLMWMLDDNPDETRAASVALAGELFGGLVGGLLGQHFDPQRGTVACATSGATWGTAFAAMSLISYPAQDGGATWRRMLVGSAFGMLTGGLLGAQDRVSRWRSALIDGGGVGGLLLGAAVAAGTENEDLASAMLIGGGLAGLVITALATREGSVDRAEQGPALRFSVAPSAQVGDPQARGWQLLVGVEGW